MIRNVDIYEERDMIVGFHLLDTDNFVSPNGKPFRFSHRYLMHYGKIYVLYDEKNRSKNETIPNKFPDIQI